jgi:TolA-binding protein
MLAGGLLALVVLGGGGWYWWTAYRAAALSQFSHASWLVQDALSSQARPEQVEAAIRALEAFIARYPRHPAVPQAAYHLGNLRYQTRAYDLARDAYRLALKKGAADSVGALCRLGIGYSWEAQGDYPNALAAYQEAEAQQGAKDFLREETLLAVARIQEILQQRDQAIDTYQKILRDLPQSGRAEEVRSRLASLEGSVRR